MHEIINEEEESSFIFWWRNYVGTTKKKEKDGSVIYVANLLHNIFTDDAYINVVN